MALEYCGIRVTDLDRSLKFYTGALGLRELRRGTMEHGGLFILLEDPETSQRLELNFYPPNNRSGRLFHKAKASTTWGSR